MTFNPRNFIKTSQEAVISNEAYKQWKKDNEHLALPFFIKGLRDLVPPIYPRQMAIILAKSGDGKSKMMKDWHAQAQDAVTASGKKAVTVFGSQEETVEELVDLDIERRGKMTVASNPSVFIGDSFGMDIDQMEDLHMTNFLTTIKYANQSMFAETMQIADIFYDYLTATPDDPAYKNAQSDNTFRLAQNKNTKRLFKAGREFSCPIVSGAQAGLKTLNDPYMKEIPIPGRGDTSESGGIYQIPDFIYSFVHMRNASTVGKVIDAGNWKFEVTDNLLFFWFLKARGYNNKNSGVSRVFPIRIINDEYVYDNDFHMSLLKVQPPKGQNNA